VNGHRRNARCIEGDVEDRLLLLSGKDPRDVRAEFFDQHGDTFGAPAPMTDRILDDDFRRARAIVELDGDRIGDRPVRRIEVIARELGILDTAGSAGGIACAVELSSETSRLA